MIFNVFAMGDNDGNISVWKLYKNMNSEDMKAIKLFKSHQDSREMIEDISWSQDVNFNFKYLIRVHFFLQASIKNIYLLLNLNQKFLELL